MKFDLHEEAVADLEQIFATRQSDGVKIAAFLEELSNDPYSLNSMTMQNFGDDFSEFVFVKKWGSIHRIERQNVWRMRSTDLEKDGLSYRFFYCYYFKDETHHLVGIARKQDVDYDNPSNPLRARIVATCRRDFPGN